MHQVQPVLVLRLYVSTVLDEFPHGINVAFVGCKVKRSEMILDCLLVQPGGHLLLREELRRFGESNAHVTVLLLQNSMVQDIVAFVVYEQRQDFRVFANVFSEDLVRVLVHCI